MIGDGFNDRLALEAAHVGIGLRGGVEAAMASCQLYLADGRCERLAELINGCRCAVATLKRVLAASLLYNVVAVAAVLIGAWGPYVCAVAMPLSSLLTVLACTRARFLR
jgi:P-type E1-E2 ATPase